MESSSSVLDFILSRIDAEKSVLSVINTEKTKSDWPIKEEKKGREERQDRQDQAGWRLCLIWNLFVKGSS